MLSLFKFFASCSQVEGLDFEGHFKLARTFLIAGTTTMESSARDTGTMPLQGHQHINMNMVCGFNSVIHSQKEMQFNVRLVSLDCVYCLCYINCIALILSKI